MKHIQTFENFLNESVKPGNSVTHRIFDEIKGEVIAGPLKYAELQKEVSGIDMPEPDDAYVKPYINKPVWIAIRLNDGQTQFGANMMEFK
jgi:hypothetical protein